MMGGSLYSSFDIWRSLPTAPRAYLGMLISVVVELIEHCYASFIHDTGEVC